MQRPNQPARSLLFPAAPNVDCYSAVGSVEAARTRLADVIHHAEGLGLLVGPAGTGKSLLCCLLAQSLRDDFHVVLLADSQLTTGETLLKHILFHLNMPYRDLSEGELRLSLIDQLTQGMRGGSKSALALIIDEAQTLSTGLLEEVRMITNIVRDGEPRVRTILAGGPELEDRLCDPKLESLNQRIASRCYLHPLAVDETARYVHDAAMRAGINPGSFIDDGAIRVVHQATGGIPRLVNQLMRQVIAVTPDETIRAGHVDRAWQTLQQLPSPLTDAETQSLSQPASGDVLRETGIVEFGALTVDSEAGVRHVNTEPFDETQAKAAHAEGAGAAEPVDPIAQTDPELAADLERVTESLERLADDGTDESWCEPGEEELPAKAQGVSAATDTLASSETDAVNLQFDCHAGDAEAELPDNFGASFRSEDLSMQWGDDLPAAAQFEATTSFETAADPPAPAVSPQAPVLPLEELFGDDFDEEEPLTTERNYQAPVASSLSIDVQAENDIELEEEVHNQIRGMIGTSGETPATLEFPSPPASCEPSEYEDIQLSDDSDLLVIEESVEVEPVRIQPPMFDDDPSDSSDYQALLNRMRNG